MLHVGLDLSRTRLDVHAMDEAGASVLVPRAAPDAAGLTSLVYRLGEFGQPVTAVIESMTGARFVHDQLQLRGWTVEIADAVQVTGLRPAGGHDRQNRRVGAGRAVPPRSGAGDLAAHPGGARRAGADPLAAAPGAPPHRAEEPDPATLLACGHPRPVADLFGVAGRRLLEGLALPQPWAGDVAAALRLIAVLDGEIDACEAALRRAGAAHAYVPTPRTAPGIGRCSGSTIAAEIGDITRFPTAKKLVGDTGLCPAVDQSGGTTRAGRWPRTARSTCGGR
jgi:transposase